MCSVSQSEMHLPRKVFARLMDCEDRAVCRPLPEAGMMVDWQMKVFTALVASAFSPWPSLVGRSVTLSEHSAIRS